ncbi:MAG: rRNA pseudouridine synthase [Alphaproteobacteria bacterium]|nr:rRNA pseudouridine synthase [Alphaproteobacteria bacterium]MDA7988422.1 rRNA pseudouridine synthase [Alphaproteobacteria bacterium]MDA8008815.1 rRNA pseudouridine synthase [Alphaproteobacteria bacterium]
MNPNPKLAQHIAGSGIASRREAENWIRNHKVKVNGKIITDPAVRAAPADTVTVNGRPLPKTPPPRLWRLHKPRGILVARSDPRHKCLPEILPKALRRLHPVGRLDLDSEGLLLLTNSAALKRLLESPAAAVPRRYRLRVFGQVRDHDLKRLARGPKLDGRKTGVIHVARLGADGRGNERRAKTANTWITVTLAEGRNRELRRLAALCGWQVNRLVRTHYADLSLARLRRGELREVPPAHVDRLMRELQKPQKSRKPKKTARAKTK